MIWIRRFFVDLAGTYLDSLKALRALPWLFAAIVLWEFAQHVVEVRIGMFENAERARELSGDPLRMAFGWVKMASIYVGAFFVIRHFAGSRDGREVASIGRATKRFVPYFVYSLLMFSLIFYAREFTPEKHVDTVRTIAGLGQLLLEPFLAAWVVACATDGRIANPIASIRRTGLLYLLALPLFFLARIPISLAHQQLNTLAMERGGVELWSILALDSLVVGIIVAITPAAMVRIARWVQLREEAKADGVGPGDRSAPAAFA